MSDGILRARLRAEPGGERFLEFSEPRERLLAQTPGELPALLERVEAAAADGLWGVGFVAYEAAPGFDRALVAREPARGGVPLAAFSLFDRPREKNGDRHNSGASRSAAPAAGGMMVPVPILSARSAALDEASHARAVQAIREAIAAGDTYQVNLVFSLSGVFAASPAELFDSLLTAGEAPYAALFEAERWAVASLSPELFFARSGGQIVMRPMKGTRPRGRYPAEDARFAADLAISEKERAENLMIVDMVRNDLGRIADAGSVRVESAFEVERYPTVWQMTSTVCASTNARLPELFAALFPCASVTGAPRAATMGIIRDLEVEPRGVYCGALGFVAPAGRARFAVGIRTLELDLATSRYRYGVGSGITWDSDPAAEWRECLDKARVLDGPPPEFELVETMLWRPGRGIELLDLHLERCLASAEYFGWLVGGSVGPDSPRGLEIDGSVDRKAKASIEGRIRSELDRVLAALPSSPYRIRMRLGRSGESRFEVEPFEIAPRAWRAAIAGESTPSMDTFAFHKTTLRARYEAARNEAPAGIDEVLMVNERGELTEGTRTNLFVQFDAEWVTPPLESGLLPGVFRESLLRAGKVIEAPLYPRDLRRAHRIRLGNALRGWIPVKRPILGLDGQPLG